MSAPIRAFDPLGFSGRNETAGVFRKAWEGRCAGCGIYLELLVKEPSLRGRAIPADARQDSQMLALLRSTHSTEWDGAIAHS